MAAKNPYDSGIGLHDYFVQYPVIDRLRYEDVYASSSSPAASSSNSLSSGSICSSASSPALSPSHSCLLSDPICEDGLILPPSKSSEHRRQMSSYAASVIRREAAALLELADRISDDSDGSEGEDIPPQLGSSAFQQAVNTLLDMPVYGKLIITGVGKSALLGRKIAATFCSLGITTIFLDPVAALHGDLGVISPLRCDPILLISYSGRTKEVTSLLPLLKSRCSSCIALTSDGASDLAQGCDVWLDGSIGGDELEADPHLSAPTSSIAVAMAMLHALALSTLKLRTGWESHETARQRVFASHHPGGSIGEAMRAHEMR